MQKLISDSQVVEP